MRVMGRGTFSTGGSPGSRQSLMTGPAAALYREIAAAPLTGSGHIFFFAGRDRQYSVCSDRRYVGFFMSGKNKN